MNKSSEISSAIAHQPQLVRTRDVHRAVHGGGSMGGINTWIAVHVTKGVGSMWAAYAFGLLALISLPAAIASHDTIIIVAWIAQTFLQLVLLPIILVGQNVIQTANDARADADHRTLTAIHRLTVEVHAINETQTMILRELEGTRRA